ncbi:glycosyltransferase family 2 protein [Streptomyces sp. NPDC014986]|uniref:glycosyltransferase family 2 protein n=1 Tax=Streptomyces sp. NPDC014986 TaxID=3364934 RepID=UPI003700EB89
MQVSVVIPTHDRPERLKVALDSLRTLDFDGQLEAIVVNDNGIPVDDVIENAARTVNVRLIDLPVNGGVSTARNAGLEAAKGEYVAFLDDDDVLDPRHLAEALPLLRSGADLVYSSVAIARTRITGTTIGDAEVFVRMDFPLGRELLEVTNHIPPSAVVCRSPRAADAWFDPALLVEEDWDMWLRLIHEHGYKAVHQPRVTAAVHRIPGVRSLTTVSSDDIAGLKPYEDTWNLLTERWPVGSERVREVRRFVPLMFGMAYDMMRDGTPVDFHYYERTVRVLYHALGELPDTDDRVVDGIRAALHGG